MGGVYSSLADAPSVSAMTNGGVGWIPRGNGVRRIRSRLGAPGGVCGKLEWCDFQKLAGFKEIYPYVPKLTMGRFVITMCGVRARAVILTDRLLSIFYFMMVVDV